MYKHSSRLLAAIALLQVGWLSAAEPDEAEEIECERVTKGLNKIKKDRAGHVVSLSLYFGDRFIESVNFRAFPKLAELNLLGSYSDRSLVHLRNTVPPGLTSLTISDVQSSGKELAKLLKKHGKLKYLHLDSPGSTVVDDEAAAEIGKLADLFFLMIGQTKMTAKGLDSLSKLKRLDFLTLHFSDITDKELAHIPKKTRNILLWLDGSNITDAGLANLSKVYGLRDLSVKNTKVTERGKALLREELPQLEMK